MADNGCPARHESRVSVVDASRTILTDVESRQAIKHAVRIIKAMDKKLWDAMGVRTLWFSCFNKPDGDAYVSM